MSMQRVTGCDAPLSWMRLAALLSAWCAAPLAAFGQVPAEPARDLALKPGVTVCAYRAAGATESGYETVAPPALSLDGRHVAFVTSEMRARSSEGPPTQVSTLHVLDLESGALDTIDLKLEDWRPSSLSLFAPGLSADGNVLAVFLSHVPATPTMQVPDIAVVDRGAGTVTRVDAPAHGVQAPVQEKPLVLSADGSCLLFQTSADFARHISKAGCFVFDVRASALGPLPCGADAMWTSMPSVSADGRLITVDHMPMQGADQRPASAYVIDRDAQTVLPFPGGDAAPASSARVAFACLSPDGRCIVFARSEPVAADAAGAAAGAKAERITQLFVCDRATGATECVTVGPSGEAANGGSFAGLDGGSALSTAGRFVVFRSDASNLVPGDTNGKADIFVRDRKAGKTVRVSVASDGTQADGKSREPSISGDGRRVAFYSKATNLAPGDTNDGYDIFVRELAWDD